MYSVLLSDIYAGKCTKKRLGKTGIFVSEGMMKRSRLEGTAVIIINIGAVSA